MGWNPRGKFMVEGRDDRCDATKGEARCWGEAGHDGNHTWKEPEA